MSFSFFKKKPTVSFVFDIRDASISIAVAKFKTDEKPEIILCQNFEFKYQELKDYKKYISSMIETLDEAIFSIRKSLVKINNKEKIGTHYFFIGSPWSISQSKIIKIIKDKIFEINKNLLEKIISSEEIIFEKSLEEQTKKPDWKVLEEKIIVSKLNGYKIDNILGKKAVNLSLELFVSFTPSEIKNKLEYYIDKKIGKNIKRQNNSCILSSYSFLRDLYSDKNDFIYIDIGKLITDVYIVREDIIFNIASFPFGEENIIQTSLMKTNLSRDIFLSHINIGQDKKFELVSHNNGKDLLKSGFDIWENNLEDILSKICAETTPNNIFIITNSVISNILAKELINKKNNKQFKILNSKTEISIIEENILNNFILNGNAFINEPYIKMDLIFLNKSLKS
ncbi:MAG: hypothetical protein V1910_01040 [bacterium]